METVLMAAAISVAVDAQRAAELAAEERERFAMRAAHLESHMAHGAEYVPGEPDASAIRCADYV